MAESPSQSGAQLIAHQAESDLASLVFEMSQQVQVGMENMLKLVNEIDGNSVGIKEEIEKSKEFAMEKKRTCSATETKDAQQGECIQSRRVKTFLRFDGNDIQATYYTRKSMRSQRALKQRRIHAQIYLVSLWKTEAINLNDFQSVSRELSSSKALSLAAIGEMIETDSLFEKYHKRCCGGNIGNGSEMMRKERSNKVPHWWVQTTVLKITR
ncbi:Uncharacterized protein Rs2_27686 [Raphanus sativus]|nr:Uncharacterized protein Rs2_27686 [Raphanus sativus]